MRKKAAMGGLWLCMLLLWACGCRDARPGGQQDPPPPTPSGPAAVYHRISAREARQMMAEAAEYVLLDVRTEEEFRERRIEGAMLIPVDEIGARAGSELPRRDALILVYCRTGRRSADAAHALVELGYTRVYDFGGIQDWPYGTVSDG